MQINSIQNNYYNNNSLNNSQKLTEQIYVNQQVFDTFQSVSEDQKYLQKQLQIRKEALFQKLRLKHKNKLLKTFQDHLQRQEEQKKQEEEQINKNQKIESDKKQKLNISGNFGPLFNDATEKQPKNLILQNQQSLNFMKQPSNKINYFTNQPVQKQNSVQQVQKKQAQIQVLNEYFQQKKEVYQHIMNLDGLISHHKNENPIKNYIKEFILQEQDYESLEAEALDLDDKLNKLSDLEKQNAICDFIKYLQQFLKTVKEQPLDLTQEGNRERIEELKQFGKTIRIYELGFQIIFLNQIGQKILYDAILGFLSVEMEKVLEFGRSNSGKTYSSQKQDIFGYIILFSFINNFDIVDLPDNFAITEKQELLEKDFDQEQILHYSDLLLRQVNCYSYEMVLLYFGYFLFGLQQILQIRQNEKQLEIELNLLKTQINFVLNKLIPVARNITNLSKDQENNIDDCQDILEDLQKNLEKEDVDLIEFFENLDFIHFVSYNKNRDDEQQNSEEDEEYDNDNNDYDEDNYDGEEGSYDQGEQSENYSEQQQQDSQYEGNSKQSQSQDKDDQEFKQLKLFQRSKK